MNCNEFLQFLFLHIEENMRKYVTYVDDDDDDAITAQSVIIICLLVAFAKTIASIITFCIFSCSSSSSKTHNFSFATRAATCHILSKLYSKFFLFLYFFLLPFESIQY